MLLRFELSEISGVEVCRRISNDMMYEDMLIIMMTANNDIKTLQESFESGVMDLYCETL
ncbi:MAG TPA: response regulator [Sulfurimonas sp.]|nr:response regulator [Sulfurimonas sp.]